MKMYAIDHLRHKTLSFQYTEQVLKDLEARIRHDIGLLGGNQGLLKIVAVLSLNK